MSRFTFFYSQTYDIDGLCKEAYLLWKRVSRERDDLPVLSCDYDNDPKAQELYKRQELPVVIESSTNQIWKHQEALNKLYDIFRIEKPSGLVQPNLSPQASSPSPPLLNTTLPGPPLLGSPPLQPTQPPPPTTPIYNSKSRIDQLKAELEEAELILKRQEFENTQQRKKQEYERIRTNQDLMFKLDGETVEPRYAYYTNELPHEINIPGNGMVKIINFDEVKKSVGDTPPSYFNRPLPLLVTMDKSKIVTVKHGIDAKDHLQILCNNFGLLRR